MAIVGSATVVIRAITTKIEQDIVRGLRDARPRIEAQGDILGKRFGDAFGKGLRAKIGEIDLSSATRKLQRQGQDAGRGFGDSFEAGFQKRLTETGTGNALRHLRQEGGQAGDLFGQEFNKGFKGQLRNVDISGLGGGSNKAAGERAGQDYGDSFAKGFRAKLPDMNTNTLRARFRRDAHTLGELFGGEFIRGFNKAQKDVDTSILEKRTHDAVNRGAESGREALDRAFARIRGAGPAGRREGNSFTREFSSALSGLSDSPLANLATVGNFAGNAITLAVGAVSSLVVGLAAVAGAAAQASGALIVIPGIIASILQGAGTLITAFKGVGDAISKGRLAQTAKADATAVTAAQKAITAAQRSIRDALEGVQKAQTAAARSARDYREKISEAVAHVADVTNKAAQDIIDANDGVDRAQRAVTQAVADAARTRVRSAESVTNAEDRLERAQRSERDAQLALTNARKDAQEQLQQLSFSLEDAVLAEQRSQLSLEQAQERLVQVQQLPPDNRLRREAELAFKEAELNLREAKDRTSDLTAENQAAAAAGVDGSQQVLDAQQQQVDATKAVVDATNDVTQARVDGADATARADQDVLDSQDALTQAQTDAADAVLKANADIANAERDLAILRRTAAEAAVDQANTVRDAQQRLADAQAGMADAQARLNDAQGAGSTQANAYRDALALLSPEAQDFVKKIVGMQSTFTKLKSAAGELLFPALGDAVDHLVKSGFFETLQGVLRDTGGVLGDIAKKIADFIGSPFFQAAFKTIAGGNNKLLGRLAEAGLNLAHAFTVIMVAAQPLINTFGKWLVDVTGRISEFFDATKKSGALEDFFTRAGQAAAIFGGLFKGIGGLLTDVLGAGAESGLGLITSLTDSIATLRDNLSGEDMGSFFADSAENVKAIAKLFAGIATIFIKMADNKGIKQTADLLTTQLLPNIEAIVNAVTNEGGPALANLAIEISKVIRTLSESGALNAFIDGLKNIVHFIGSVITILNDAGLLKPLLTLLGTFKAIQFAAKFVGLEGAMKSVLGGIGGLAEDAAKKLGRYLAGTKLVRAANALMATSFKAVQAAMSGPILIGIIALVLAIIYAYRHFDKFRAVVDFVVDRIQDALGALLTIFKVVFKAIVDVVQWFADIIWNNSILPDLLNAITEGFKFYAKIFIAVWTTIFEGIVFVINTFIKPIIDLVLSIFTTIIEGAKVVIGFIGDHWRLILALLGGPIALAVLLISKYWDQITGFFSAAVHWVQTVFSTAWDGLRAILVGPLNLAKTAISNAMDFYFGPNSFLRAAYNWVINTFKPLWNALEGIITNPIQAGKDALDLLLNGPVGIVTMFRTFVDGIGVIWEGLKAIFTAPINFVIGTVYNNGLRRFWNGIAGKVPGLGELPEIPLIPVKKARGGVIPGYRPGKDTVPAMLSPGEGILRPEVVRALGKNQIDEWNRWAMGGRSSTNGPRTDRWGRRQYFQGGVVAPSSSTAQGGFDWPWDHFKDVLKTLDPRNVADGLSHLKDVVVGALADSLRVLILKPLRAESHAFAESHPTLGAFAAVPGGLLEGVVSKMIDFLDGKDKAEVTKQMASGGILSSSGTGRWQFPLPQGSYRWGKGFGDYPGHTGQDLPAPRGTKIAAVGAGKVVISRDIHGSNIYNDTPYDSYGRYVKIEHPGNIFSLYGHMLRRIAQLGQIVARGQVIGLVDSTGKSTGDHLHFEIRPNDIPSYNVATFLRNADPSGASDKEHTAQGGSGSTPSAGLVRKIIASRYGWDDTEFAALNALVALDGGYETFVGRSGRTSGGLETSLARLRRNFGTPSNALAAAMRKSGRNVFHSGGWVGGRGEVPSLLQSGEYVFSREQSSRMRNGAIVMPKANGDLQVIAEVGTAGTAPTSAGTDAETLAALKRLVAALEKGESVGKIDVHPSPGMDERELAAKVGREVAWKLGTR